MILDATVSRSNKGGPSFSLGNRAVRALWIVTWLLLARWTPRPLTRWRCFLARCFGARIGHGVTLYGSARIWLPAHLEIGDWSVIGPGVECYNMAPIRIGHRTVVSQRAYLCAGTHDFRTRDFQLVTRPITIGDDVWIASEAFVGPGITVGDGVVMSARACAFRTLDPWTVYSGNPAVPLKPRVPLPPAG